ncbi:hypothetical protein ACFS2C_04825 [Prauserella oleivorans]|uniref:Uncharacterized protein n=1 Tax=Prauserella oleivorans TaxID=1478153 RepID=A0ABW5W802_9PSEU
MLLVLLGVLVLAIGLGLVRYRQARGYRSTPYRPPLLGRLGRVVGGTLAALTGVIVSISALSSGAQDGSVWLLQLALPIALLVAGARLLLLWLRGRALPRRPVPRQEPEPRPVSHSGD